LQDPEKSQQQIHGTYWTWSLCKLVLLQKASQGVIQLKGRQWENKRRGKELDDAKIIS
jgi:hypothetical protein